MGQIEPPRPVMPIVAQFSRHPSALDWGIEQLRTLLGSPAFISPAFDFNETHYYDRSMGTDLKKRFLAYLPLRDPVDLPSWKIESNKLEEQYAQLQFHAEARPLNLDPGYLTEAKLVLATTKDRDHRLYLRDGIYAEGTLYYHHGQWTSRSWTYPDYQRADFHQFFTLCREALRKA